MSEKPHSPACERNRGPILQVLRAHLPPVCRVLEVGSGTGQHAVHFGAAMPGWQWHTSDRTEYHPGIHAWLAEAALPNVQPPLVLDVTGPWPAARFQAVYTANTLHIMGWPAVQHFFAALPAVLEPGGWLVVYGPFNRRGAYTSESNAAFDADLKARDPAMGLRDLEAVQALATAAGLAWVQEHALPANNLCAVWQRRVAVAM